MNFHHGKKAPGADYFSFDTADPGVDTSAMHNPSKSRASRTPAAQMAEPTLLPPQCLRSYDLYSVPYGSTGSAAWHNGTGSPAAVHPALLRRYAQRAAVWELWDAALGADRPSSVRGTAAGPAAAAAGAQHRPHPVLSGSTDAQLPGPSTVALDTLDLCKVWHSQAAKHAAAAGGRHKILIACVVLLITIAVGMCFVLYATRSSYPLQGPRHTTGDSTVPLHDAATVNFLISSWLQQQLQPGCLSQFGHLLAAVIPILGVFGVPGVLPGVAADLKMTDDDTWLLMLGVGAFLICCGVTMLAAVKSAADQHLSRARQQQLRLAEQQLRNMRQPATAAAVPGADAISAAPIQAGLQTPMAADTRLPADLPIGIMMYDALTRPPLLALCWLLVPLFVVSLASVLPAVVVCVLLLPLLPQQLVLQLPANLLLRGGRMRWLRLLNLLFAVTVSPTIAVLAGRSPYVWHNLMPSYPNQIWFYQHVFDHGVEPAVAALQLQLLLLFVTSSLHVVCAVWDLSRCAAALGVCLQHAGQLYRPVVANPQQQAAAVDVDTEAVQPASGKGREHQQLLDQQLSTACVDALTTAWQLFIFFTCLPAVLLLPLVLYGFSRHRHWAAVLVADGVVDPNQPEQWQSWLLVMGAMFFGLVLSVLCHMLVLKFMSRFTVQSHKGNIEYQLIVFEGAGDCPSSDWLVSLAADGFPNLVNVSSRQSQQQQQAPQQLPHQEQKQQQTSIAAQQSAPQLQITLEAEAAAEAASFSAMAIVKYVICFVQVCVLLLVGWLGRSWLGL